MLCIATYEHYRKRGLIRGKYDLRRLIIKQRYPREVISVIGSLLRDLDIKIINDYFNYKEYTQVLQEYRLLPTDAQIVLT